MKKIVFLGCLLVGISISSFAYWSFQGSGSFDVSGPIGSTSTLVHPAPINFEGLGKLVVEVEFAGGGKMGTWGTYVDYVEFVGSPGDWTEITKEVTFEAEKPLPFTVDFRAWDVPSYAYIDCYYRIYKNL